MTKRIECEFSAAEKKKMAALKFTLQKDGSYRKKINDIFLTTVKYKMPKGNNYKYVVKMNTTELFSEEYSHFDEMYYALSDEDMLSKIVTKEEFKEIDDDIDYPGDDNYGDDFSIDYRDNPFYDERW